MTRLERQRKKRRGWAVAVLIVCHVAMLLLMSRACTTAAAEKAVEAADGQICQAITKSAINAVDHPQVPQYMLYKVPLDGYTRRVLWEACQEWDVPYELALAVCWRETQYQDLVTAHGEDVYYGMMAVQLRSAKDYMALCGVEHLNSVEDRLRVGCCILGSHLKSEGNVRDALRRYSAADGEWYADDVLWYMEEKLG